MKIESEIVLVSGAGVELRVPIRRCLLGEQMVLLLMQTAEGRAVSARLLINSPKTLEAPSLREDQNDAVPIRVAFGPDLEPIHPLDCRKDRCVESCSPSYKDLLTEFGLHDAVVMETADGCHELAPDETQPDYADL